MRNKSLAIVAILLGVLALLALLWAGNVVAGPPMQGPEGGEEGEVTAEGEIEAQAIMDDGFWYQGLLTDGAGNPLANTNVNVTFRIYNVSSGGTALDSVVVTVNTDDNGLFNEEIDFNNHDLFNGQALWLGLQVAGEASEMTPRQYLRPVPYALSIRPGAVISGSVALAGDYGGAALAVLNDDGRGVYAEVSGGGNAGRFISHGSPSGVYAESDGSGNGIYAVGSDNAGDYGGQFRGWGGIYTFADTGPGVVVDDSAGIAMTYSQDPGDVVASDDLLADNALGLGAPGVHGAIYVRDDANETIFDFTASNGLLTLGGPGEDGDLYLRDNADSLTFSVDGQTGDVYADGGYNCGRNISCGPDCDEVELDPCLSDNSPADFAEILPAQEELEPGDVLVVALDGTLARSSESHQPTVVGVYSTRPSYVGSARMLGQPGYAPLAIVGIVPVKASAENGSIQPGDLLVASSIPGHAMKADPNPSVGTVIGKALGALEEGTGLIDLLVMLQ